MASWYVSSIKTNDKDIIDIVKRGAVTDFEYDEKESVGYFNARYGIGALDIKIIADTAKAHKSSFRIESSGDYYSPYEQVWEYTDGVETEIKNEKIEPYFDEEELVD